MAQMGTAQADSSAIATMWSYAQQRVPPIGWLAALSALGFASYVATLTELGFSASALATVVAVGVAALTSGIAGFAFSAICGAMLFQFRHDTVGVVETMLICSIANQAMSVWLLRREIRLLPLAPFLLGGAIGVPLGVWLLLHLNVTTFKAGLGILLVVYSTYMLVRRPITLPRTSRASDVVSGFFGGVMGGFAATPGAAVSIWCGMKGWDKARQRAVFQPFILLMQFVVLGTIAAMHAKGAPIIAIPALAWACVPAGLLGTWWGMALFKRLTDNQFGKAVNVLLIVSGIGLLV
jgi:uncharacterized membrane protein YfcA